jgi:hypothetical protein
MNNEIYYNMFQDGGALIKTTDKGAIELYEIPLYGATKPIFMQICKSIESAKKLQILGDKG